jgi:hypothetical protein
MMDEEEDDFVTPFVGKRSKSRIKKRKLPPIEKQRSISQSTSDKKFEMSLSVIAGPHAGEFRKLICEISDAIDCGRSKKRKISFPLDYSVSEMHAVVYLEEIGSNVHLCLCDRNSTNGTSLNGKMLRPGIETSSDKSIHSITLGDTCFQVTLRKIPDDDDDNDRSSKVEESVITTPKSAMRSCFICGISLDHLNETASQIHVNQCLDNQESTSAAPSTTPNTSNTLTTTSMSPTTTTTTTTTHTCAFCSDTFESAVDLLQHMKPCAAIKKITNEILYDEIRRVRSTLHSNINRNKRKHDNDSTSNKKNKKKKRKKRIKKPKPLVETPSLGRKAKLAAKKDPELALALALSVSMECLDALPTEELESRLSTLQTQISNLQDRAAVLHEILQRRRDLSEEKARAYEMKRSEELAMRRVALIDPSKAAQSLFGGNDDDVPPGVLKETNNDDDDEEEEEEEEDEEEKKEEEEHEMRVDPLETKGRSRREAGLSLWSMTACAGDDDLDGVRLTQSKFVTTSLLERNDEEEEKIDDDDDNDDNEEVTQKIDDDNEEVTQQIEYEEEEEKKEVTQKIEDDDDDDNSVIDFGEDEDEENKKDDDSSSIVDLTQQQSDENDQSHIFDTQNDDMRELLLGIADAESDISSTQKTKKTSSFVLDEPTVIYDHVDEEDEEIPSTAVVTGGLDDDDSVLVLSDDDDDETKTTNVTKTPRTKTLKITKKATSSLCPDYAGMKVDELHKLVKKYGMRKCSKRIMVQKLTEIWRYLNNDRTTSSSSSSSHNALQSIVPRTSSQPTISTTTTIKKKRSKQLKRSATVQGTEENADPRATQLLTYIRSHRKLHEKILMMQTIDLAALKQQLECDGIRVSTVFLRSFLEDKGVSFSQPWRN